MTRKGRINPGPPERAKIGGGKILFSFDNLRDTSFTKCKSPQFMIDFLLRLKALSAKTWSEVSVCGRHSYGYEKNPVSQIKKSTDICADVDYLLAFRANGGNHPFLGYREGNVFHIVFIEARFGDIYEH